MRNLLVMSAVFSMFLGLAVLVTSVMLLDALRKEQEHAFIGKDIRGINVRRCAHQTDACPPCP